MIPDSGGAGRTRGGPGQEIVLRCTAQKPVLLTIRPDLMKFPAPGLYGGGDGALGDVYLRGEKVERFIPLDWHPGDEVILRVPGGGGFGDPKERAREKVIRGCSARAR